MQKRREGEATDDRELEKFRATTEKPTLWWLLLPLTSLTACSSGGGGSGGNSNLAPEPEPEPEPAARWGEGPDIIRPGTGAEPVNAGGGNDVIVMVGRNLAEEPGFTRYQQSDIGNPRGTGLDLSSVLELSELNASSSDEGAGGGPLDGGTGDDTLVIYGRADLTGRELRNIEQAIVNSDVSLHLEQLGADGITRVIGGSGSMLRIEGEGEIALTALSLQGVVHLELGAEITLVAAHRDALAQSGLHILSGAGRLHIEEPHQGALEGLRLVVNGDGSDELSIRLGLADPMAVTEAPRFGGELVAATRVLAGNGLHFPDGGGDKAIGTHNADTFILGAGDTATGRDGDDVFGVQATGATITDFSPGDRLRLEGMDTGQMQSARVENGVLTLVRTDATELSLNLPGVADGALTGADVNRDMDGDGTATTALELELAPGAPGRVSIRGIVREDSVLRAQVDDFGEAGEAAYQWLSFEPGTGTWKAIAGATAATFTPGDAQVGALLRVQVTQTDAQGNQEKSASTATAPVANVNDGPEGAVRVVGTPSVDRLLTADTPTLRDDDGLGEFNYRWQSSSDANTWSDITGATSATFTPGDAQVGALLRVLVSWRDGHGTHEQVVSDPTSAIAAPEPMPVGRVQLTGTAREDEKLQADLSELEASGPLSYQWQISTDGITWSDIAGARAAAFTPGDAQVTDLLRLKVAWTSSGGDPVEVVSDPSSRVANLNDPPEGRVTLVGPAREDQPLGIDVTTLRDADGLGELSRQWQSSEDGNTWSDIPGATSATFTPDDAQVGALLRVQIAWSDGHGTREQVASDPSTAVANLNDSPTGEVVISGLPLEGQRLESDTSGLADDDGLGRFSYQWQFSEDGSTWTSIRGATSATFTPGNAQVDGLLRVQVAWNDGHGTREQVTSAPTEAIANVNSPARGGVQIVSGRWDPSLLQADIGAVQDADGLGELTTNALYRWQWSEDGLLWNALAEGETATLGGDIAPHGSLVRVQVSWTDARGSRESLTSSQLSPPLGGGDNPVPGIRGIPSAAALGDGKFIVLGGGGDILGQNYDSSTLPQGNPLTINTHRSDSQLNPDLVVLSNGSFVVVWHSENQDANEGSPNFAGIYAQRFDASGNKAGGEFPVHTYVDDDQENAAASALVAGGFLVVWQSRGQEGRNYGIYGQNFDAQGEAAGNEFRLNQQTPDHQRHPDLTTLTNGQLVAVWQSRDQDEDGYGVFARRLGANGNPSRDEFQVNSQESGDQQNPRIAALTGGSFAVVWESHNQADDNSGGDIYGQRFSAAGSRLDGEFSINTHTADEQLNPAIAALADGGFVVVWQSFRQANGIARNDIYGQRFNAAGEKVGAEFRVNVEVLNDQITPSVSPLGSGFLVAWSHSSELFYSSSELFYTDSRILARLFEITADANDAPTGAVQITGPVVAGVESTLDTASLWDGDGLGQLNYQWQVSSDRGASWRDIPDATTVGFTPDATQVGEWLRGQVSWSDGNDNAEQLFSGVLSVTAATVFSAGDSRVNTRPGYWDEADNFKIAATVASRGSGFLVVWEAADEHKKGLYGQRFDAAGVRLGDEFSINTHTAGTQGTPASAVLKDGDFVVVWQSRDQDATDSPSSVLEYGIYGQRYRSSGEALGEEFRVNTHLPKAQAEAAVAALSDGGFVVIWESENQDAVPGIIQLLSTGIYGQRYDAAGTPMGSEFRLNTTLEEMQLNPDITALADGGFVAVWQSEDQDGSELGIYGQRYDAMGDRAGGEFRINSHTANDQQNAAVADLTGGGFVVVWQSRDQDGSGSTIHGQRYDSDGDRAGSEFRVNGPETRGESSAEVAALGDGGFVVVWESSRLSPRDNDIYGQRYDASGDPLGGEFRINLGVQGNQQSPTVTALEGGFLVSWKSAEGGVHLRHFDLDEPDSNNAPRGQVHLLGTVREGETLQADADSLWDGDGLGELSWQWQSSTDGSSWSDIAGAKTASLVLTAAERGLLLRAQVSWLDGQGNQEKLASDATGEVAAAPQAEELEPLLSPTSRLAAEALPVAPLAPELFFSPLQALELPIDMDYLI